MSESESLNPVQPVAGKFLRFCQWIAFSAVLLIVLVVALAGLRINVPGSPIVAYFVALALGLALLVAHSAPLFFQMTKPLKKAAYLAIPLYVGFGLYVHVAANDAFAKTPEGKALAKQQDAELERRVEAEVAARHRQAVAAAERDRQNDKVQQQQKLAACFGVFGNSISALEEAVKDSLHNPSSFEHVETTTIEPDSDGNNVRMVFRGENGFGGIRTASIKAAVNPATCVPIKFSEPDVM